jgi:hypothetical protein
MWVPHWKIKAKFQTMKRAEAERAITNAFRPLPNHFPNSLRETAKPRTKKGVREIKNRLPNDEIPSQH